MEEKEGQIERGTKVFIQDDTYAWLPGELASSIAKSDATAPVYVTLPDDWGKYTFAPDHSSLRRGTKDGSTGRIVRTVKLDNYAGNELPLQNVDEDGELLGQSDMADLPHLHEAAILYNLKDRHKRSVPYTRVGDIVVAVNPYQWIEGLYSEEKQQFYADKLIWNAQEDDFSNRQNILEGYFDRLIHDPHVYETSAHAYCGVAVDRRDQTILVSGESGAGKTETVKIVMTHLATLGNTCDSIESGSGENSDTVNKVLESNPVFEAFGNAKTVTNDNSSRFGKFTKLHFNVQDSKKAKIRGKEVPICVLSGSTFETYLLEKSRVVAHDSGERSYHFFYQLLAAPEEDKVEFWEELKGATCESFRYVGEPEAAVIEGRNDADAWHRTKKALCDFGFSGEKLKTLMQAVCTVLQLGNLTFAPNPSNEGALITSQEELDKLSGLMGVPCDAITDALTTRQVKTMGEEIAVKLTPSATKEGCDALAKEIYAQVFQALVGTINQSTSPPKVQEGADKSMGCISILDMFGFECFAVNRFEQLCINYANERIQHKYVTDTFLSIKEEYEAEGIEVYNFSLVDNSDVLALVEGRTGLIMVLNEECVRPKGNDESFVYKVKTIHKGSKRLVSDLLHRPCEFAIRHFAGTVKYDATRFVERNADQLPKVLLDCAISSKNDLISHGIQQLASEKAKQESDYRRKRSAATICSKFKTQLTSLMGDIQDARTRYIRCIKPNRKKQPLIMDHKVTMRQLASAGLVTAITVSRETFPNQLPYDVVWDRFHILLSYDVVLEGNSTREKAEKLLQELLRGRDKVVGGHVISPFACGTSKVFFRSGSLEMLESDRLRLYSAKATILQRLARVFIARQRYHTMKSSVIVLQAVWRRKLAGNNYQKCLHSVLRLQCWGRRVLAVCRVQRLRRIKAAAVIQSSWRAQKPKEVLRQSKSAAVVIQRAIRSKKDQHNFKSSMATVVEEAHMDHKMKLLQTKLNEPSSYDKDDLLRESAKMIQYLSKQLYMQRGRTSHLKTAFAKDRADDNRLVSHTGSVEAALAANKLEVSRLRRNNTRLETQLSEYKTKKASTRFLLKKIQDEGKAEMSKQEDELIKLKGSYMREIESLKTEMKSMKRDHIAEVSKLEQKMAASEEEHRAEVTKLKKEIQNSEESYEDDVSKILDALQIAHEEDTRRKKPANNEEELKKRIEFLTSSYETELKEMKETLCDKCAALCQNRGLMSSPAMMRSMGELYRDVGSRHLVLE